MAAMAATHFLIYTFDQTERQVDGSATIGPADCLIIQLAPHVFLIHHRLFLQKATRLLIC